MYYIRQRNNVCYWMKKYIDNPSYASHLGKYIYLAAFFFFFFFFLASSPSSSGAASTTSSFFSSFFSSSLTATTTTTTTTNFCDDIHHESCEIIADAAGNVIDALKNMLVGECQDRCHLTSGCVWWTWYPDVDSDHGHCWLLSSCDNFEHCPDCISGPAE